MWLLYTECQKFVSDFKQNGIVVQPNTEHQPNLNPLWRFCCLST